VETDWLPLAGGGLGEWISLSLNLPILPGSLAAYDLFRVVALHLVVLVITSLHARPHDPDARGRDMLRSTLPVKGGASNRGQIIARHPSGSISCCA